MGVDPMVGMGVAEDSPPPPRTVDGLKPTPPCGLNLSPVGAHWPNVVQRRKKKLATFGGERENLHIFSKELPFSKHFCAKIA